MRVKILPIDCDKKQKRNEKVGLVVGKRPLETDLLKKTKLEKC